jgi:hypothetical protein
MMTWLAYDATTAHLDEIKQDVQRGQLARRHRRSRSGADGSSSRTRTFWHTRRALGARS